MNGFVRHITLNNGLTREIIERKKQEFFIITDDGNIKYESKRINDYTIEYKFYATRSQIDISGYAFQMTTKNKNIDIKILYNDEYLTEYFTRKSLLDNKLLIEVVVDIPTRCRKEFKITIKSSDKKKINVNKVYRRTSIEHNRYTVINNKN